MNIVLRILVGLFMVSCVSSTEKITSADDLKQLANELSLELQTAKIDTDCSKTGLQTVEEFLESKSKNKQQKYVVKVGAYLGECIIESYGGAWIEHEPGIWAIKFSEGNIVFPIGKVHKFVEHPEMDSFSSFYSMIPIVFNLNQEKEGM